MECDFSGWATKASVKCSDGRTIMPNAFEHQDQLKVPLVWSHQHKDVENVLGHVLLENKPEGMYAYAFFNDTPKAKHAKQAIEHGDITQMSIWANSLRETARRVMHGAIREVSLVLSGANPGALIENVQIRHADGDLEDRDDEAIITTGLELEHSNKQFSEDEAATDDADGLTEDDVKALIQSALDLQHAEDDETVEDVYNSMTPKQQKVLHFMLGAALEEAGVEHSEIDDDDDQKGSKEMAHHNVFESSNDKGSKGPDVVISHDDMKAIVADAKSRGNGSLKDAVYAYAQDHLEHGIDDIDVLFPEAKTIVNTPELFGRRVEWVQKLMGSVKKQPFSRIKTISADITEDEARAKGYITGTLKKEEFFRVNRRVTVPTTIYKKQKLDRDDMIDITDFDVVAWLKAEMRVMLDEELARAVLVGDGRPADHEDKIDEEKIRPIASDHELYTTTVTINLGDANSAMTEVSDALILNRGKLRGSGLPTLFTTETYIARFMILRDQVGRNIYQSLDQLATQLRVAEIVPVEILEEYPEIVGILVNPADYTVGATAGGEVSLFDDFDIDYNQYKYLIETRCSGALTKLKSALVLRRSGDSDALVVPTAPTFDGEAVTIVDTTGVVYTDADTGDVLTAAGGPYAVADGETLNVHAAPAAGKYFSSSDVDDWSFENEA